MLDKTGTITLGNRMASQFVAAPGIDEKLLADAAQLSSLADETPEGRSIVVLAKEKYGIRGRDVADANVQFIPFSAQTRMSGVDVHTGTPTSRSIRKGAVDAIRGYVESQGGSMSAEVMKIAEDISKQGATPLAVTENGKILGVIQLKDVVKGGIKERFMQLRRMGIIGAVTSRASGPARPLRL